METPFSLNNKKILVTGASSGIGRSIAIECSKMGAEVILLGRNEERLQETIDSMKPGNHFFRILDLNNNQKVDDFINDIEPIDGFVNSAGIINTQLIAFLKEEDLRRIMETNFFGPSIFVHKLVKKKKINKPGTIVFISSLGGNETTSIGLAAYASSKSAILGLSKTMALELASKNIRVNCILPGMIRTELLDNIDVSTEDLSKDEENYPLGYGNPEDVAYAAIYLLSDASKWVTGINLKLDGGLTLR